MNLLKAITLHSALTATLGLASFAPLASAAAERLTVNVPFSFEMNGRELPPGAYTVSEPGPSGIVFVQGAQKSAMTMSVPQGADSNGASGLVFESVNGKECLIGIQIESAGTRSIPVPAMGR